MEVGDHDAPAARGGHDRAEARPQRGVGAFGAGLEIGWVVAAPVNAHEVSAAPRDVELAVDQRAEITRAQEPPLDTVDRDAERGARALGRSPIAAADARAG